MWLKVTTGSASHLHLSSNTPHHTQLFPKPLFVDVRNTRTRLQLVCFLSGVLKFSEALQSSRRAGTHHLIEVRKALGSKRCFPRARGGGQVTCGEHCRQPQNTNFVASKYNRAPRPPRAPAAPLKKARNCACAGIYVMTSFTYSSRA